MVNLAICDDDKEFLKILKDRLHRVMGRTGLEYSILDFLTAGELEKVMGRGQQFDIIFLDIELTDCNGKQLAERLRRLDRLFKLVFISHYGEEVFKSFPYEMTCFIPKSQFDNTFESEMEWILDRMVTEQKNVLVFEVFEDKRIKAPIRFHADEIIDFKLENKVVTMHTQKQKAPYNLGRLTLDDLEADLLPHGFFRSHRSAIVNMEFVHSYEGDFIILEDGRHVPLSRQHKAELGKLFFNKISGKS